ncbi:Transmembrane protein [Wickerhamomyces ciferrii]|uniref:Transmembrane protein n=1 Tax=Wickerhamomyces ciferrii (strain ATCC 14091 / BCRC 22168 / CBS 111 / JCM 3599 / NBRC 0793 / NRRL Y-1031 F-60-10) TaxID=1206466 RepID=K0KNR7_WICCF|nr:Transmembrane protein [Wickerhamomyces ciferrii]CCH43802.1 Transmembrane protein [Wickerhamomyces ciferrii]
MANMLKQISVIVLVLVQLVSGLHFYTSPGDTRCFYEELPKDQVVIGKFDAYVNSRGNEFESDSRLKLSITVDETFDNDHRVVSQKSSSSGDFTFSALDSGEHKFCITPSYSDKTTKIRVFFDLVQAAGETIDSKRKDEVSVLTNKVKQLNNMIQEIQNEQKLMRVS